MWQNDLGRVASCWGQADGDAAGRALEAVLDWTPTRQFSKTILSIFRNRQRIIIVVWRPLKVDAASRAMVFGLVVRFQAGGRRGHKP